MADPRPGLQFQKIWSSAITRYNQDTKRDYLERGLVADSPDDLFVILDKEMNRFKQYRKRGERVRHAIRSVLELVNLSSGAIGDSLATAFPPAKAVFVAVWVLLKAAKDISGHYDMIIDMFEKLKGFMGRLDVYVQHEITDHLKKIIVSILAQVLVVLGVATKWMKQSRLVQYWKVLFGNNTEVSDAMGTLRILSSQEVPMVTAVILATTTTTSQNIQASEDGALRDKIRSWLKPPDPTINYNTAIEARQVGTGAWFIQSQDFVDWTTTPGSFLWIRGKPGNGKTIICSTVIEALQRRTDSSVALAYFYFNFNDSGKLVYRNMLHSLVFQILRRCPGPLRELYERTDSGFQQPTVNELLDVLQKTVVLSSHTYIVLDGLDECVGSERTIVLEFLATIQSWHLEPLHVLAASRPEQEIKEKMESLPGARHVDLHDATSRIDQDIHRFLTAQLERDPNLRKWEAKEKASIRNALVARADGMFQWVRCQLDSLRNCVTLNDLKTALNTLPETLDGTYERILRNIPVDHQGKIQRILEFLCFSTRPMMLGELAEVVTVAINSEGEARYDSGNRMRDPSEVLSICGSLVSLLFIPGAAHALQSERWHPVFPRDTLVARFVRLSHFSVKEYLSSRRIRTGQASFYSLNAQLAHRSITMTCLTYLMRFDTDGLDGDKMKQDKDKALASYASQHWIDHYQQQGPDPHTPLQKLAHKFFHYPRRNYFLNWTRMYDIDQTWNSPNWHRAANMTPDPLYYACKAGLLEISEWLLTQGAEVNAQSRGGAYGNALQAASARGHDAVIRLLLDRGAEVNTLGGIFGGAVQVASYNGHKSAVELLLDRGAEVNAQGRMFGGALQSASEMGHEAIVRLLLDRGADVNAQGGSNDNALQAACLRRREPIVRLLLDHGAHSNMQSHRWGNALQAACFGGNKAIVQLLLDLGALVNAQGGYYGNALQAASVGGSEPVVRLLLDRGAWVNAQGGNFGTALQAASANLFRGNDSIVRLLLDQGAHVNAQSDFYGNALHVASFFRQEDIARTLLDRGAEVNAQGGWYGNALQAASANYHEGIVRLLLDQGAIVNAQGGEHGSALWAALNPNEHRFRRFFEKQGRCIPRILWDAGARLYTMPSDAHSEEYIYRLPPETDPRTYRRNAATPKPRRSRRRSWS